MQYHLSHVSLITHLSNYFVRLPGSYTSFNESEIEASTYGSKEAQDIDRWLTCTVQRIHRVHVVTRAI